VEKITFAEKNLYVQKFSIWPSNKKNSLKNVINWKKNYGTLLTTVSNHCAEGVCDLKGRSDFPRGSTTKQSIFEKELARRLK
jgi:hypothetical protein